MKDQLIWICPNCESKKYISYIIGIYGQPNDRLPEKGSIIGAIEPFKIYVCNKCSRIFADPDKFNLISDIDYDK